MAAYQPKVERYYSPCTGCGVWFEHRRKGRQKCKKGCGKLRGRPRKPRGPFACAHCEIEYFTMRPRGEGEKYCSRECAFADPQGRRFRRSFRVAWFNAHLKAGYRLTPCSECGAVSLLKQCGDVCRAQYARRRTWELYRRGVITNCAGCGIQFCSLQSYGHDKCCSNECLKEVKRRGRRIAKRKRRARGKTNGPYEALDPIVVFSRDGWRCQACGDWTPEELRGTHHDNAPEMDHITPLSKGGRHSMDNVQCPCRLCNLLKSDMDMKLFEKEYIKQ